MEDFDLYRLFKTLHVMAVLALGGGFVLAGICGPLVARAGSIQELRAYARLMYISENFLSIPAAIALAVFGYLTADRSGMSFEATWLVLGQVFFYVIVILALAVLRPAANKLHRAAQAAPDGPLTPEIAAQVKQPLPAIVGALTSVLFAFVVYLMVAKPAW